VTADRAPSTVGEPSAASTREIRRETMLINMGPQHPSTHGVLRLLLELDGETVLSCTPIVGYLHTGIEKNTEYRTWQQGVTFVTRADYLSPFFNEVGYCLAVEKLLGSKVEDVRTAIAHGKFKRQGRFMGQRPDWKKAYVKLREGEKVPEFLEGA